MKKALSKAPSVPAITKARHSGIAVAESILCVDDDAAARQTETVRELLRATSVRNHDDRFLPLLSEVLARIEPVSHWGINE